MVGYLFCSAKLQPSECEDSTFAKQKDESGALAFLRKGNLGVSEGRRY